MTESILDITPFLSNRETGVVVRNHLGEAKRAIIQRKKKAVCLGSQNNDGVEVTVSTGNGESIVTLEAGAFETYMRCMLSEGARRAMNMAYQAVGEVIVLEDLPKGLTLSFEGAVSDGCLEGKWGLSQTFPTLPTLLREPAVGSTGVVERWRKGNG